MPELAGGQLLVTAVRFIVTLTAGPGRVEGLVLMVASPAGFEPATFRLEGGCSVH